MFVYGFEIFFQNERMFGNKRIEPLTLILHVGSSERLIAI